MPLAADTAPASSVLLVGEGTYPYDRGGVTTWCDRLVRGLPEVAFDVVSFTSAASVQLAVELPNNVRSARPIPLWGVVEPTEFTRAGDRFARTVARRARTTGAVVERLFVPLLRELMARLAEPDRAGLDDARLAHAIHRYFLRFDHRATMHARPTWTAFRAALEAQARAEANGPGLAPPPPGADEVAQALRWLYTLLLPLTVSVAPTDVVHATLAGVAGLTAVVAAREHDAPMLITDHGISLRERHLALAAHDLPFHTRRFLLRYAHWASRACYAQAARVLPVCTYNWRWERRLGVEPQRLRTIYNGVDTEAFQPLRPEPDRPRPTIVTVARVFPLKDIETLVRAVDVARRRVPDVQAIVYGDTDADSDYTDAVRALIGRLDLNAHVELAGHVDDTEAAYRSGDVFALSSVSEGFPFSVIEAMACGRPVVATDVGGVREAVEGGAEGPCGIVVPPVDSDALGNALADALLDRRQRAVWGRRARDRAVQTFGIGRMLDAYREVYAEVARGEAARALSPQQALWSD